MQIPSLSSNVATTLGANVRADGSQQDNNQQLVAQGQSDQSVQATGRISSSEAVQPAEESTLEVAVSQEEPTSATKVVTSTDEVLGTSLGLNIDVTV